MIKLEGSEKQIAWAEEIMEHNIRYLHKERDDYKRRTEEEEGSDFTAIVKEFERVIEMLETKQPSAKWWIEHKSIGQYARQEIIARTK